MSTDPFSTSVQVPAQGSKVPHVVAGLALIGASTFGLAFYLPLHGAQTELASAFEKQAATLSSTQEQLTKTTEQLEATEKQRGELSATVKKSSDASSSAAEAAVDLHTQLTEKLSALSKKKKLRIKKDGDKSVIIIDDLRLFRGHEVSVHGPGKKVLCPVAKALVAAGGASEVVVGSHTHAAVVKNPILRRTYATVWEASAARAANAVQTLRLCGFKSKSVSAAGFANTRPGKKASKRSPGELRIEVSPAD